MDLIDCLTQVRLYLEHFFSLKLASEKLALASEATVP